jgi:hypothetical protein
MSKLLENRELLESLVEKTQYEYYSYKAIIEYIGDDAFVDLDWDELCEATNKPLEVVEELLNELYNLGVIYVDYEQGVIE